MKKHIGRLMAAAIVAVTAVAFASDASRADDVKDAAIAANKWKEIFRVGKAEDMAELLPASYVKDIEAIVHLFGERMDEELWTKGREHWGRIFVLGEKAKIIVNAMDDRDEMELDEKIVYIRWLRSLGKAGVAFAEDGALSLENLKIIKLPELLKAISPLTSALVTMPRGISNLGLEKYVLTNVDDAKINDDATVTFSNPYTRGLIFVNVEGKWIPKDLADGWERYVESSRENLARVDFRLEEMQKSKTQVLGAMASAEPLLKRLAAAKSSEEIKEASGTNPLRALFWLILMSFTQQ